MHPNWRRTLPVSVALAAILAAGVTLIWFFLSAWTGAVTTQLLFPPQPSEQLTFTQDGKPLVQSSTWGSRQTTVYRHLDGQPVDNLDKLELNNGYGWLRGPESPNYNSRPDWRTRIIGFAEPAGMPHYWYLINDGRPLARAYFQGFDAKTNREIGYLGKAGFRAEPPPLEEQLEIETKYVNSGLTAGLWGQEGQEPYPNQTSGIRSIFLVSNGALYKVDLRHRSVSKVLLEQPVLTVGNVEELTVVPNEPRALEKPRIAARSADRIRVLDEAGQTVRTLTLPDRARDRDLMLNLPTTGEAIVVAQQDRHHPLSEIYWLDQQNGIARQEQIALNSGWYGNHDSPWLVALAVPAPLVLAIDFAWVRPWQNVENGTDPDFSDALAASLTEALAAYLVVAVISALLAVVCYRRHVRYQRPGAMVWAVFVFLGGPAALAGYWLHARWPATERCRQCGATLSRDRERCPLCSADFSLPARQGTEIFA